MMNDINIPSEVEVAVANTLYAEGACETLEECHTIARATILAMLENWPGANKDWFEPFITLPLPQENTDAES